jgi:hypothetical protein
MDPKQRTDRSRKNMIPEAMVGIHKTSYELLMLTLWPVL